MKAILKFVKRVSSNVVQSIAFYPVLISFGFFVVAMVVLELEDQEAIIALKEELSYLFIQDYETARAVLSTFIGGILSLTVFSFTMVMVVLNQASSNFSPRLLPNLIADKTHQIILGIYIGTLLYCTIVLIYLGAHGIDSKSMGMSTMLAAIFALVCIAYFVYFIHNISRSIQIDRITERIFASSKKYLDKELERQYGSRTSLRMIDTKDWKTILSDRNGYFMDFDASFLDDGLVEQEARILVIPFKGEYIWKGTPVLKIHDKINEREQRNLLFCMNMSASPHDSDEGISGMVKLMEIAVKALSPGINDPGTAIGAIHYLGQLLHRAVQYPTLTSGYLKGGKAQLIRHNVTTADLMRILIQPIRRYARTDMAVMYELVGVFHHLEGAPNLTVDDKAALEEERQAIMHDVETRIENPIDRQRLLDYSKKT